MLCKATDASSWDTKIVIGSWLGANKLCIRFTPSCIGEPCLTNPSNRNETSPPLHPTKGSGAETVLWLRGYEYAGHMLWSKEATRVHFRMVNMSNSPTEANERSKPSTIRPHIHSTPFRHSPFPGLSHDGRTTLLSHMLLFSHLVCPGEYSYRPAPLSCASPLLLSSQHSDRDRFDRHWCK